VLVHSSQYIANNTSHGLSVYSKDEEAVHAVEVAKAKP